MTLNHGVVGEAAREVEAAEVVWVGEAGEEVREVEQNGWVRADE